MNGINLSIIKQLTVFPKPHHSSLSHWSKGTVVPEEKISDKRKEKEKTKKIK